MFAREYVEEKIVARLTKVKEDDVFVSDRDYAHMLRFLDGTFHRLANNSKIPGFSEDDLISFMYLKTHQLMRRDQWDETRNFRTIAYRSMTNLIRDIIRMQDKAINRGLDRDPLDIVIFEFTESPRHLERIM